MIASRLWLGLAPLAAALITSCTSEHTKGTQPAAGFPTVRDERLELSLLVSEPAIVTPIGIAIDAKDRIFVLESHTHLQGTDYRGPTSDRIRVFIDKDGRGGADSSYVFADGFDAGMNLAFSPAGVLHLVTAKAVWALYDHDGDGVSDARTAVLRLAEPAKVYPHAALLTIAFSPDGWMYVSRGNTGGSAWTLVGTDGSAVRGFGDGGNIVRARPDGSHVEEFATGFWNAFALTVDSHGRVLAADNDPDSRGPNRLLHIVAGGDYGYRSLYGGSGIHPYASWNGELPGTLPYAAPLGEAPSGILDASQAALPADYRGSMLVTIWEESNIVSVPLGQRGASVGGTPKLLVQGGTDFHPVAFATNSRGTIYFTDWEMRAYPNHGQGRIWRLASRSGADSRVPGGVATAPDTSERILTELAEAHTPAASSLVLGALRSIDPFVRHAAVMALARPPFTRLRETSLRDGDATVRMGALLATMRADSSGNPATVRRLLADPDEQVRRMALVWVGRAAMTGLRRELDLAITTGAPSLTLFETYLATIEQLEPEFVRAHAARSGAAKDIARPLPPRFIERFVATPSHSNALRALAISYLEAPSNHVRLLTDLAQPANPMPIRLEAVRSLAYLSDSLAARTLLAISADRRAEPALRAEALAGMSRQSADASHQVLALLDDASADVRLEAARYLRARTLDPLARARLQPKVDSLTGEADAPVQDQLRLALATDGRGTGQPVSAEQWATALANGGDPQRGRRVFHSVQAMCSQCHQAERRGGSLGPDLSNIGRSKTRTQILQAILHPSAEISPEYQGWFVRTKDGRTHYGRQIDVGEKVTEMYGMDGKLASFTDVAAYGPMEKSLMPEGLQSRFTVSELRDLLSYLEQSR